MNIIVAIICSLGIFCQDTPWALQYVVMGTTTEKEYFVSYDECFEEAKDGLLVYMLAGIPAKVEFLSFTCEEEV